MKKKCPQMHHLEKTVFLAGLLLSTEAFAFGSAPPPVQYDPSFKQESDLSENVFAETHGGGNGGGVWGCVDSRGQVKSIIDVVDLYEAVHQNQSLELDRFSGTAESIARQMQAKLRSISPALVEAMTPHFEKTGFLKERMDSAPLPDITYTSSKLTSIEDSLYKIEPEITECKEGTEPKYIQTVNFEDPKPSSGITGEILVQKKTFEALNPTQQAGLIIHEAMYSYLREEFHDEHSRRTRKLVGLLFSTLTKNQLKKAFEAVLGDLDSVQMEFVPVGRFEIQTTEVNQAQWFSVMKSNPAYFQREGDCANYAFSRADDFSGCPTNPVEQVSYDIIVNSFLPKLNSKKYDGCHYRLPTLEEWVLAARGEDGNLEDYAWFKKNSSSRTHESKKKKPTGLGRNLYDMHGNVWEWTASLFNPSGRGIFADDRRSICGGSWLDDNVENLRSARPLVASPDDSHKAMGFRLVRTCSQ